MDTMVRNMKAMTTASDADVVRMASLTPAQRVGLDGDLGSLEVGKRADVLVLGAGLDVRRVFIGGEEFRSEPLRQPVPAASRAAGRRTGRGRGARRAIGV
jgi:N-acetylglucosamine-6-phosphate deacetylase